ncbi:mechanosensitive ion channel domain-containing protein [Helicobacter sp. 23-1044]
MKKIVAFLAFALANLTLFGADLANLNAQIQSNAWIAKYKNYNEYNQILREISRLKNQLDSLNKSAESKDFAKIDDLEQRLHTLERQEELLRTYKDEPYKELLKDISETPKITNPFLIQSGYSYIKNLNAQLQNIEANYANLQNLLDLLDEKIAILQTLQNAESELKNAQIMKSELDSAKKVLELYMDIFKKNATENIAKVNDAIRAEALKLLYITLAIALISAISFAIKFILKLYARSHEDSHSSYAINKIINVINISLIILISLFAYIENVAYIIAIIGFVSAGFAIAMKDWFMSFFGYMVIMGGGMVKSGDRIRVVKDGVTYVGDVIDISMLRITLYEDVTYTTYSENRRAGRIIFIPNNLIFTTMFANYSHENMKTAWDGVDITITFKSNYKKALRLASQIAKKYSSGYTESTRRNLNLLKVKYSLRDMNVEPRVFSFIVPNGIKISVWFQTNSYATLMLNSLISGELIEAFTRENDIEISYPTTTIVPKERDLGADSAKNAESIKNILADGKVPLDSAN